MPSLYVLVRRGLFFSPIGKLVCCEAEDEGEECRYEGGDYTCDEGNIGSSFGADTLMPFNAVFKTLKILFVAV